MKKVNTKKNYSIGIIGGRGKMGSFFQKIFKKYTPNVFVWGRKSEISLENFCKNLDIIIISVPIDSTKEIIRQVKKFLTPKQCITDFTSLKQFPMEEMKKNSPASGKFFGMHPMFAPPSNGKMEGQNIIFCSGNAPEEEKFFRKIFEQENAFIINSTANEHDRLMTLVQGLSHFLDMAFVKTLHKSGFSAEKIFNSRSPAYALKMILAGRTFAQDGNLYGNIQIQNPQNIETLKLFFEGAQELFTLVKEKNLEGFEKIFDTEKKFLGKYADKSQKESDLLIEFLAHKTLGKKNIKNNTLTSLDSKGKKNKNGKISAFAGMTKHSIVGILGPEKTFSHIAAQKFFPPNVSLKLFPSIPSIFSAYKKGEISEIFVPIENLLHGSVVESIDGIVATKLPITQVFEMKISPSLFVPLGVKKKDIEKIFSHPQALAQCSDFLDKNFSGIEFIPTHSTTAAMEEVLRSRKYAAIAAPEMIDSYEVIPLQPHIANQKNNATRFAFLSKEKYIPSDALDEGAVIFSLRQDSPGGLENLLHQFSSRNINLTKIESRPTGRIFGEYIFFISYSGSLSSQQKKEFIDATDKSVIMIQFLGEYEIITNDE